MFKRGTHFIYFLLLINVISCGYMGDPVPPQFLSPKAVQSLGATVERDNSLVINWFPPSDNKNGDDFDEDRLVSYRILRGEVPYDIKSQKLKFSDFQVVGELKNQEFSDGKQVTYKLKNIPLRKRFAFVVVPFLGSLGDRQETNLSAGAVYDYVSFYSEPSYTIEGEFMTDIKVDTLNSIYAKPAYFGLQ